MTIEVNYDHTNSRFELSQIYLLVGTGAQDNRFNTVEIHVIDAAHVP